MGKNHPDTRYEAWLHDKPLGHTKLLGNMLAPAGKPKRYKYKITLLRNLVRARITGMKLENSMLSDWSRIEYLRHLKDVVIRRVRITGEKLEEEPLPESTALSISAIDTLPKPSEDAPKKNELHASVGSRSVCTAVRPMPLNAPGLWVHPDAKDTGRDDPYYDHYLCPHCNTRFKVEVAE